MKVIYKGPGPKTYHPILGELVSNKPFDLDGEIAEKYINSGLLEKAEQKTSKPKEPLAEATEARGKNKDKR